MKFFNLRLNVNKNVEHQTGKTTAISRTAVREDDDTYLRTNPGTPRTSQHYSIEDFQGGPELGCHYAPR